MKKTIIGLLAAALILLGGAALAEANLTLLVYMCGSDLQSAACDDIYEMGIAETGDAVNVVILAGGASQWDFDEIEGNTRSLITVRDGYFESVTDWGWASMGSEESLLEFLEYGLREYPAHKTAVVLWDHGAGTEAGLCFDETTEDEDGLSLLEINNVLYDLNARLGGFHIDILGCDACMMATYEMAAMLSYYDIDYFVASEELESGSGWHYTPWLEAAGRDPSLTAGALCAQIIDSYMAAGRADAPDDCLTLSAIDLGQIGPLQDAMERMGGVLLEALKQGSVADVTRGRSRMYTFGAYVDGSWDMVDLGAMLDAYAAFDPDGAAEARRALSRAVVKTSQTDNLNPCSGLSVLIPQDTKNEFETYSDGMDLSFYMPNWMGFVKCYADLITQDGHAFAPSAPEEITGSGFLSQIASLFSAAQPGVSWNGDAQAYEPAETSPAVAVTAGADDYAFTATLAPGDLQYLDYVEGMLMMDVSEGDSFGYVDLGLMRNNLIDWDTGAIYSLFDGTWPIFGEQLVPLYDQINNEYGRRSLIPVKLNGEHTYLVVEFAAGSSEGRVLGTNAGYDDNGLPIRNITRLSPGDRIVPVYTMYFDDGGDDFEEMEFDGDEILWAEGMKVTYEDLGDDGGDKLEMMFSFVLNDVFGEYDMTDVIAFEV